jgi:phosphatidylinositol glycan class H protein
MPGRLKVQRPSPTTVSFTVSNAPQRSSSPAKILFGLQVLLRAVLFFCVISVCIALLRHLVFKGDDGIVSWPIVWSTALGSKLCRFVDSYNPLAIALVGAVVIYGVFRRGYTGKLKVTIRLCMADRIR